MGELIRIFIAVQKKRRYKKLCIHEKRVKYRRKMNFDEGFL